VLRSIRALLLSARGVTRGLPGPAAVGNPIELFRDWFETATKAGILLPESMTLATATRSGAPSARLVLLKDVSERGFTFYTNFGSRKADELDANPRAALAFHWAVLQRQVRVEGVVERVAEAEAAAYFRTRARGSQIGAWASRQSAPLADRAALEAQVGEMRRRFEGGEVPLPPFWGGYRVIPEQIEFWQGRLDRLHDRLLFRQTAEGWAAERLQP